ncbi:hypothetical protein FGU65_03490 [Methanoculleus sp. FWC-SCC1]|uniref:DUF7847 domain-containing protein n=1 Tax=Methanoculleus frigidifontis TaxID=2584085 RepID=A0ABT8M7R4_9EURY|nr:hypothetical protein [Methanoculleus sp. FWC-SCC1]MDN7023965.1 hypothetical protein [Methanoculleus sp. FWC-SCC1]
MVLESFTEALGLLRRRPILWSIGLVMGAFAIFDIALPFYGGTFYAEPLALLQVVVVPLLTAGVYGTIKTGDYSPGSFAAAAKTYYFRVLLPALVIFFAAVVTVLLLAAPVALIGFGSEIVVFMLLGVFVTFVFFTFFYDTAAVFEDAKVFDSIRRSVEFVLHASGSVLLFFVVTIGVLLGLGFAGIFVWAAILAPQLEPLTQMNATELQTVMPQDILPLIGGEGIWVTAIIYALVVLIATSILHVYKACFFRRHARPATLQPQPQGEYDEKGRWYKY